jgi:protease-4
VASMADIAASGGYYIASACETIYANYGTITGSIGVISTSANFKKLLERFGVSVTVVKSGRYKDMMSPFKDTNREELKMIQKMIDSDYKKFLRDVALGRSMNQKDIEPYADGRIFNGAQAKKYKLIDQVGTFKDAIEFARKKAKLPVGCPLYEKNETSFSELLRNIPGMFKNQKSIPIKMKYRAGLEYRYM